ncbi:autophagy-related protein 16-1-like [Leptopilina heterotoma]|uniref:autophagy-related protein 16-1-like n=1 Tax=Leptopilina heterotoma TaxID=63436 RepID=UPI001CAA3A9C|nr:autophagy-related protein 16-1-like [Leptopilina heterotoma]
MQCTSVIHNFRQSTFASLPTRRSQIMTFLQTLHQFWYWSLISDGLSGEGLQSTLLSIETKFAGSSCNDLVTSDGSGSTIISGHFDKRIRFWDSRAESSSNDIPLQGKITSLDLSRDANYLLSCVRDDTVKLLDLRMKQIVVSFSADGFKVGCDWARATFSPDGQYIAVGSSDGSVYVWSVATSKVETVLKDHSSAVTAVSWHPHGTFLASVDRAKKATIWDDHV